MNRKTSFSTRHIVIYAVLSAMYVVLSLISIPLGNMKITLEAFPVLLGASLLGPVCGLCVGFLGSLLNQLLTYGLTVTTILWVLPHAVSGLVVGLYAGKKEYRMNRQQTIFISAASAILVTVLNTAAMAADSLIFGYYSKAYVFGALAARLAVGIVLAVLFGLVLPKLTDTVRGTLGEDMRK